MLISPIWSFSAFSLICEHKWVHAQTKSYGRMRLVACSPPRRAGDRPRRGRSGAPRPAGAHAGVSGGWVGVWACARRRASWMPLVSRSAHGQGGRVSCACVEGALFKRGAHSRPCNPAGPQAGGKVSHGARVRVRGRGCSRGATLTNLRANCAGKHG